MFIIIVFSFMFLATVFIFWRVSVLTREFGHLRWLRFITLAVAVFAFASLFAQRLMREKIHIVGFDWVQWCGLICLGFLGFLLFFLVLHALWRLFQTVFLREKFRETMPSRRSFLAKLSLGTFFGVSGGLSAVAAANARYGFELTTTEVFFDDLPQALDGFRIVQLSDIHVSDTIRKDFVAQAVEVANTANADIACVTGDLVDGYVEDLNEDVAPLENLQTRFGKYYVTGNHEYYWGAKPWIEFMQGLGFQALLNENRVIDVQGSKLLLAGVTDLQAARFIEAHTTNPAAAIQTAETVHLKVLLAHQPNSALEAEPLGFDLQISGHTHGGQLWPWGLLVYAAQRWVRGLYEFGKMKIYVNRGTGTWGPPMRLGSAPEVTLLILRTKKPSLN